MLMNLNYISIFVSVSRLFHSESQDACLIIRMSLKFPQSKLFLECLYIVWARNWFCVPFVLSHAPHPPQMSNCGMGRLEIRLQGLPRPKRNPAHSPSCYTAQWPTTVVSDLLCMGMKSMKINVCRLNSKWDVYLWLKHH